MEAQEELNGFLRSHRVLAVDRYFVDQGTNSFWSVCVDYLEGATGSERHNGRGGKPKVDYREVLSAEDFAVFAQLRQWRKEAATAEGVPVYMVFTNEQLAHMVRQRVATKTDLAKIDGVGDARVEKYGEAVLEILRRASEGMDEACGKPV